MQDILEAVKKYFRNAKHVMRISETPERLDALEERVEALERHKAAGAVQGYCEHCGSSDLEPFDTVPSPESDSMEVRIIRYRCRACGQETTASAG